MKIKLPTNMTQLATGMVLCTAVLLSTCVANVQADVLAVKNRTPAVGVTLIGLKDGQLEYRLRNGRQTSRPIEQIEYLQITDSPLFNLAEKQQRDKHFRPAINSYEKLLTELIASNDQDGLDRKLLVQCRLLRACDIQGRFDRAVELYLEIIERMPGCLGTLRPSNVPAAGSMFLQSARPLIEAALTRHADDDISASLTEWLNTWPDRPNNNKHTTTDNQRTDRLAESGQMQQVRAALAEIQKNIDDRQFDQALMKIKTLNNTSAGKLRADLYYFKGKALMGKSLTDNDRDHIELSIKRAGLAFMRVVIHFPGNAYQPECLYHTGQICKQLGLRKQAAELWSEATVRYPESNPWSKRAQKALEQL